MDQEKRDPIFEDITIPDAPSTKHLYCEADDLYVKGKGKGIEINNMLTYTGWEHHGRHVSLTDRHLFSTVEAVGCLLGERVCRHSPPLGSCGHPYRYQC